MNTRNFFVVDVESSGPVPGMYNYSMLQFAAVKITDKVDEIFHGKCRPLETTSFIPEAIKHSGCTWEEALTFPDPAITMVRFKEWLMAHSIDSQPVFWSDNVAFDWQFMNYYCWNFLGENPFGFSGRRIGDFYCGLKQNLHIGSRWKKLRKTKHTHNPVDDAKGNVEAFNEFCKYYEL